MNFQLQYLLILAPLLFVSLFFTKPASAAVRCETQYGGTQVCVTTGQLQVNKQIFCDPALSGNEDKQICKDTSDRFIDNMGLNFHRFSPGEEVRFRIKVKNVGDAALGKVTVTDTPPTIFLQTTSGPLTFDLTNLQPGEVRQQEIKMKVLDTDSLPQNSTVCVVNAVEASAEDNKDRDTSQVCLERKVLGVKVVPETKELPSTGAEVWLLSFGSVSALLGGAKLTRFKRKQFTQSYYQITENRFIQKGGEK